MSPLTSLCPIMMKSPPTLLLRFQAFPKCDGSSLPGRKTCLGIHEMISAESTVSKQRQYWFIGKMIGYD